MKQLIAALLVLQALAWPALAQTTLRPTQIRGISSDTVYGAGGLVANGSPTITTPTLSGTTTAGAINSSGAGTFGGSGISPVLTAKSTAGNTLLYLQDLTNSKVWQVTQTNDAVTWYDNGVTARVQFTSTGINSTVIGATTPAAGSFTTLSGTDALTLTKSASSAYFAGVTITNSATDGYAKFALNSKAGGVNAEASINWANGAFLALVSSNTTPVNLSVNGTTRLSATTTGVDVTGALSATGGMSTSGSISGYGGGEVILAGGSGSQNSISTTGGGAIQIVFDHRGSGNTGSFQWRNGTGAATTLMTLDGSGNLGLGVAPSAWAAGFSAFQFSTGGVVWSNGYNANFGSNHFYNGSNYIYKGSDYASRYQQVSGVHQWYTAPSGTAGNAISFTQAMTLDASGILDTIGGYKINGGSTLSDYTEGSFTATATGFSGSVSGTAYYTRVGNTVTLELPYLSGTSNANTFTLTGLPSGIRPANYKYLPLTVQDNSGSPAMGYAEVSNSTTITLYPTIAQNSSSTWTASAIKGLPRGGVVSYTLN